MKSSPLYNELRKMIALAYENQLVSFLEDEPLEQFTKLLIGPATEFRAKYPNAPLDVIFERDENNPESLRVYLHGFMGDNKEKDSEAFTFAKNLGMSINRLKQSFLNKNPDLTENDCYLKIVEESDKITLIISGEKK